MFLRVKLINFEMFSFEIGSLCNLTQKKKQTKQNKRKEIWKRERESNPGPPPQSHCRHHVFRPATQKPATRPSNNYNCKSKKSFYKWVQVISLSLCVALWLLSKMTVKEKEKNMKYSTLQSTPLFLNSQIKKKWKFKSSV